MDLIGYDVPYIIGVPSVTARVIGESEHGQYVLRQDYRNLNEQGEWEDVRKEYYRDKDFITRYWFDVHGIPLS